MSSRVAQTGDRRRIAPNPPVQLAECNHGHGGESERHPQREQEPEDQHPSEVFQGGQHAQVPPVGTMRRRRPRAVPTALVSSATCEPRESGDRDIRDGRPDPIVHPGVRRPQSSHRKNKRPGSRTKRSWCPAMKHCIRVAPGATTNWHSPETVWARPRRITVTRPGGVTVSSLSLISASGASTPSQPECHRMWASPRARRPGPAECARLGR